MARFNSAETAQAIFEQMDTANAGVLSLPNFAQRLHDFGQTDQEIERLFNLLDTDGNQVVDLAEFINGYKLYARLTAGELGQEWRLWSQLDQQDEADRLKLAKL